MKLAYDEKSRGLLIELIEGAEYHESEEVVDGVVIDFDRNRRPIRIELEDASAVVDVAAVLELVQPRIKKGADLRALRKQLGLSQEELGDALDIPRNTIARWERGEMSMEKTRMLELAIASLLQAQDRVFRSLPSSEAKAQKVRKSTVPVREHRHVEQSPAVTYRHATSGRFTQANPAAKAPKAGGRAPSKKK